MRVAGIVLSRLGGGCSRDAYVTAMQVELGLARLPFVAAADGALLLRPGAAAGSGHLLLLFSAQPGGLPPSSLARLEASLEAQPQLAAGGCLHFEPGGTLHAQFLSRSD